MAKISSDSPSEESSVTALETGNSGEQKTGTPTSWWTKTTKELSRWSDRRILEVLLNERIRKSTPVVLRELTSMSVEEIVNHLGISEPKALLLTVALNVGIEIFKEQLKETPVLKTEESIHSFFKNTLLSHKSPGVYALVLSAEREVLSCSKLSSDPEWPSNVPTNMTSRKAFKEILGPRSDTVYFISNGLKTEHGMDESAERNEFIQQVRLLADPVGVTIIGFLFVNEHPVKSKSGKKSLKREKKESSQKSVSFGPSARRVPKGESSPGISGERKSGQKEAEKHPILLHKERKRESSLSDKVGEIVKDGSVGREGMSLLEREG